jgi:hypothetical protein
MLTRWKNMLHMRACLWLCCCFTLQVLPVNDTCVYNMWWDSYPYSSVSVHALHPQYVALCAMLDDLPGQELPADIAAEIEAARVSVPGCGLCSCFIEACCMLDRQHACLQNALSK